MWPRLGVQPGSQIARASRLALAVEPEHPVGPLRLVAVRLEPVEAQQQQLVMLAQLREAERQVQPALGHRALQQAMPLAPQVAVMIQVVEPAQFVRALQAV
ncbi:hypothetical protein [Tritonibacter aquimaris]|uniref:hypothetical protein n=1 Tax=Tritonibacter aquimaris TaxID=2663379 RepID=UPI001F474FD9|nr:hypothetical protein [Tritonibacter aquimaris]